MKPVVPKLQETILYGTRRDVQLEHCIVLNVPISPKDHKMVWITILLRSLPPHNLMSPSSVNFFYQELPGFYAFRQHRNTQHGMQVGSRTRDVNVEHIVGDVKDHKLREDLRSCHYFLVDYEHERAKHKVFDYAVETLNETIVNEKVDNFFNNLKCAAKVRLAFGFVLRNIEDGGFRYLYAHENNTLPDRSKLVCTRDNSAKP